MNIIQKPSPHWSSRRGGHPRMIIIHGDAGKSDAGTISWMQSKESGVSYHYLVGRGGEIYQFVGDNLKAWHAGRSEWDGVSGVNSFSIGVSFANDGTGAEPYRRAQYGHGGRLIAKLCTRYRIPCDMIRSHAEVSPGRKTDPWTHFDWAAFYTAYGMWSGDKYGIPNANSP